MIKTIFTLLFFLVVSGSYAQSSWKEMDDFHELAAKAFHSAEGGKLKPARDSAAIILATAKKWQASTVPAGYNESVVKPLLEQLVQQCAAISKAVELKQKDKPLKLIVSRAHDTFHELLNEGELKK